jgi:hypothetical protein
MVVVLGLVTNMFDWCASLYNGFRKPVDAGRRIPSSLCTKGRSALCRILPSRTPDSAPPLGVMPRIFATVVAETAMPSPFS